MDVNAAVSLQNLVENNSYKPPKQTSRKSEINFESILERISSETNNKTAKNDRQTQENYDAVLAGAGICINPVINIAVSEENQQVSPEAIDLADVSITAVENQSPDLSRIISFMDITEAFTDIVSSNLLSQYITKNYPQGTVGQNPREEFAKEIEDIIFKITEDYSGFTKTQMSNPNMTASVIGFDKFADDDFIQEITNDIISAAFDGKVNSESEVMQTVRNAVQNTMLNPEMISFLEEEDGIENSDTINVFAEAENLNPADAAQVNTQDNYGAYARMGNNSYQNYAEINIPEYTGGVSMIEDTERMITMSDGTAIPESSIIKSSNIPDANGIYPAGTEYIESSPLIGKGSSPAVAVLMSKVGDEDGLVRPSDFVQARNIVFSRHENTSETFGDSVYMPINERVAGVIEYAQSDNSPSHEESGRGQSGGFDFAMNAMNATTAIDANNTEIVDFQVPQNTAQAGPAVMNMIERATNNLIQSQDGAVKQMQIQLHPETLGNIVIKLESIQGGVNVKIITSNPEVRDLVSQSVMQMSVSIRSQGVNLVNIDVSHSQQENFDGSSGNSAYYDDSGNQRNDRRDESAPSYKEYMKAVEDEKIRRVLDSIRNMGI